MRGELEHEMNEKDFLFYLKEKMQLKVIKHTPFLNKKIKRVALCGGSGSFLLPQAIQSCADVYISADFKYHEYFDADNRILIADIGHYESEVFTKDLIFDFLNKKFVNIAIYSSEKVTNPISYL
jgi:putative NIF3 family GTP cyclohydrolase 1 type 2